MKTTKYTNKGFSLIELMVAVAISVIILAGVLTMMSASKKTYTQQMDRARLQENARFALDFISRSLRMAGYFGCADIIPDGLPAVTGLDSGSDDLFGTGADDWVVPAQESDVVLVTYMNTSPGDLAIIHCARDPNEDGGATGSGIGVPTPLPAFWYKNADANDPCTSPGMQTGNVTPTPIISGITTLPQTVQSAPPYAVITRQPVFGFGGQAGNALVANESVVAAADCIGVETRVVAAVNTDNIVLTRPLSRNFDNDGVNYGAEVRRVAVERYYVAESDDNDNTDSDISYSLYRDIAGGYNPDQNPPLFPNILDVPDSDNDGVPDNNAQSLIEGVETLQIRWGEDTDDDTVPDVYRTATDVTNWENVAVARVTLLLTGENRPLVVEEDSETYNIDAAYAGYQPQDHRWRTMVSSTINLRNIVRPRLETN